MWDTARTGHRGYGWGYDGGYGHYVQRDGAAKTAIGLAAGFGGAALFGVILTAIGANQVSKARYKAAENAAAGNAKAIDILATQVLSERSSRETWQNQHAPSLVDYINVTSQSGAGAGAGAGANALSNAAAIAAAINQNSGINSAIGGYNFLRVARYSAPKPCDCDSCNG